MTFAAKHSYNVSDSSRIARVGRVVWRELSQRAGQIGVIWLKPSRGSHRITARSGAPALTWLLFEYVRGAHRDDMGRLATPRSGIGGGLSPPEPAVRLCFVVRGHERGHIGVLLRLE